MFNKKFILIGLLSGIVIALLLALSMRGLAPSEDYFVPAIWYGLFGLGLVAGALLILGGEENVWGNQYLSLAIGLAAGLITCFAGMCLVEPNHKFDLAWRAFLIVPLVSLVLIFSFVIGFMLGLLVGIAIGLIRSKIKKQPDKK